MGPDQDQSGVGEEPVPFEQGAPDLPPDIRFGAAVGSLMGACVGWASCWLAGEADYVWHGAVVGAMIGSIGGGVIGARHRKGRRDPISSEIGTTVCLIYALLPGLLILLGGIGFIRGRFSGLVLLGVACAFPMAGLLIGGLLDRVYEGVLRRRQEYREGSWPKGNDGEYSQ